MVCRKTPQWQFINHLILNDIKYDQGKNFAFHQKLECLQYDVALTIKAAIRGSSNLPEDGRDSFAASLRFTIAKLLNTCSN